MILIRGLGTHSLLGANVFCVCFLICLFYDNLDFNVLLLGGWRSSLLCFLDSAHHVGVGFLPVCLLHSQVWLNILQQIFSNFRNPFKVEYFLDSLNHQINNLVLCFIFRNWFNLLFSQLLWENYSFALTSIGQTWEK